MAQRVSSPVFVGRGDELERVSAAMDHAASGQPAAFLVAGEAGVGKTRFVAEIATRAGRSGARVLEGGCVQVGTAGLPFSPFIEALRGLTSSVPPDELDGLLGAGRSDLARLIPQLASEGDPDWTDPDDPSAQSRLFEHLLLLLDRLSARAPVLLVVEDLHWADRSTLGLMAFFIRNLRRQSIMLLATYRSDELHSRHPLLSFLAEQQRAGRAERIELRRFEWHELADQIRAILGYEPDPELIERIMDRSQGNAFYAEELLAGGPHDGRLPDTLREVLLARLASLGPSTQRFIHVAAAGGARVSLPLIATVMASDQLDLEPALREAAAAHVLVPLAGPTVGGHAFRHALLQEAAYSELLPGERTRLHAAFAGALAAEELAEGAAGARAAEIAYHWQEAHDLPRAFDAWLRAALAAEHLHAYAEAADDFDHVLALWDKVPDADTRAPIDRVEILTRAARASEGPAPSRSVEYIRAALALIDPDSDPVRAGLLYESLGHYLGIVGPQAAALAAYEEGVRLVPPEPPSAARARVLAGLGTYFAHNARMAECAAVCAEAVAIGDAVDVPAVWAMIPLGVAHAALGDVELGLDILGEALEIAAARRSVSEVARAMGFRVRALVEIAREEEAIEAAAEAEAWAASHGFGAGWGVNNALGRAEVLMTMGRWDEAADAIRAAQGYGRSLAEKWVERQFALLDALRGQFESARERLARQSADDLFRHDVAGFAAPAELALWSGDPRAARAAIRIAITARAGEDPVVVRHFSHALVLAARAEADVAAAARPRRAEAELDEARSLGAGYLAQMRAIVEEVSTHRPAYLPIAAPALALCEAEFTRLEGDSEPDTWAAAARAFASQPYLRAYALTREGEAALAGPRHKARAAAVLGEARAIATRLGARPLLRLIETLATASGAPRQDAARGQAEARGRYDLSPRELEVLQLLAEGRTDGEIADALFISPKTASVHVANIKGKLGARSRVEIVTSAIAIGLVDAPSQATT